MSRPRIYSTLLAAATAFLPFIAEAQVLQNVVNAATRLINFALGILIGLAILAFFWGLVRYLWGAKGGPDQKKASMLMVYGIVALFFMLSVFGIIRLLQISFGVNGSAPVNPPLIGQTTLPTCTSIVQNFGCLAQWAAQMFGTATALLVGGALVLYFWSIAYNMFGYNTAGSASSLAKLRSTLLWGLLALFIMFSIWGIIRILGLTLFGTNNFNSL